MPNSTLLNIESLTNQPSNLFLSDAIMMSKFDLFSEHESNVRSYCRDFPAIFTQALSATLSDIEGREYIDFLSGAGSVNYGHNNPKIKKDVLKYLNTDGIIHSLDLHTSAKYEFIKTFSDIILKPKGLNYKIAFPGPTGTNAIELALKLARKSTKRHNVVTFTNALHGMTQGALSLTGSRDKRDGAGIPLSGCSRLPYDNYIEGLDSSELLEKMLLDKSSGLDLPAAIVLETIQGEGGLNMASPQWLRKISEIANKFEIVLVVDDIQAGCGRTGNFFSFEYASITPDIVCLSKSLGGIGFPLSIVLLNPKLDVLNPGQHNGTFRGNNLAFVAATSALQFWKDKYFLENLSSSSKVLFEALNDIASTSGASVLGRGLMRGLVWDDKSVAKRISSKCFESGLIIETCGPEDDVLKLLPPLTISPEELTLGLNILKTSVELVLRK